jgi:eukaryotic-like serine/threonine-protein kinase
MFFRSLAVFLLISTELVPCQTMFHGNPAHTGVYDSAGPTQSPTVKWAFHTGGPIVASPAVSDGVVYIASMDGHVYAIDQETG